MRRAREGKGVGLTPGGLTGGKERAKEQADPERDNGDGPPVATANREESAEAIVAATPAAKGRTQTEGATEGDHAGV